MRSFYRLVPLIAAQAADSEVHRDSIEAALLDKNE